MLCIGGPLDGAYMVQPVGCTSFRVPVNQYAGFLAVPSHEAMKPVEIDITTYVEDAIHTPGKTIFFWRPDTQSIVETLDLLFTRYAQR
jgi:hypothetical protein